MRPECICPVCISPNHFGFMCLVKKKNLEKVKAPPITWSRGQGPIRKWTRGHKPTHYYRNLRHARVGRWDLWTDRRNF